MAPLGLLLASCVGSIDEAWLEPPGAAASGGSASSAGTPRVPGAGPPGAPGAASEPTAVPAGGAPSDRAAPTTAILAPAVLRRLTRREYVNTVRDLLGIEARAAEQFPSDKSKGWPYPRAIQVAPLDAAALQAAAEAVAAEALPKVPMLLPCDPRAAGEAVCARQFIDTFGARAFRRPLFPDEAARFSTQGYEVARGALKLGFNEAIGLVIEAMLQAPGFLYHWQVPPGPAVREGGEVRLSDYEMASRLSYFLWGTMPDQELFAAAAARRLGTAAEVEAQARRLLRDARARETLSAFVEGWLDLDELPERPKSTTLYKEYNEALRTAMAEESRAFAQAAMFEGEGKWETLVTASFSFVNKPLAGLYGMPTVTSTTLQKVELDPAQRLGLFTRAAWLSVTGARDGSHPTRRGHAIYTGVLCRDLPPPPPEVPAIKPPSSGLTTRERFEDHDRNGPACSGCHNLLDPIGFAFESYDGIGRYRTSEGGKPVDASGSLTLDGETRTFGNAIELVRLLAKSHEARRCFATQWTRYALGRVETEGDRTSIDGAVARLAAGGDVRELLAALTASRMFRYRGLTAGEVLP